MSRRFIFYSIILIFIACNSQHASEQQVNNDIPADSTAKTEESIKIVASPYELTTEEIKDDSVFADGSIPSTWANAGFSDPVAFKQFLKRVQFWVANNYKDSVAEIIAYPLRAKNPRNKEAFLSAYDSYINDNVKKALGEQNFSQIFRRDQGAMIGNGQLWFNEQLNGFKIIAINP